MCLALLLTDGYHLLIILSFIIFSEFTKTFFCDMWFLRAYKRACGADDAGASILK